MGSDVRATNTSISNNNTHVDCYIMTSGVARQTAAPDEPELASHIAKIVTEKEL